VVPSFTTPSLIKRNELLLSCSITIRVLLTTGCLEPDVVTCAMRIQDRTTQVFGRRSFHRMNGALAPTDSSVSWSGSRETIESKGQDWTQKCEIIRVLLVIIPYAIDYKVVSAEGIESARQRNSNDLERSRWHVSRSFRCSAVGTAGKRQVGVAG